VLITSHFKQKKREFKSDNKKNAYLKIITG
jgi:hypothetical protein